METYLCINWLFFFLTFIRFLLISKADIMLEKSFVHVGIVSDG